MLPCDITMMTNSSNVLFLQVFYICKFMRIPSHMGEGIACRKHVLEIEIKALCLQNNK